MSAQKSKRRAAGGARQAKSPKASIVLRLPRVAHELEPGLARARQALRHPSPRPAAPTALPARPAAAQRAPAVRQRPAPAPPARRLPRAPPHAGKSRSNSVDVEKRVGAGSARVGRSTPERGSHPTRTRETSRVAPRVQESWNSQDRFSMGRPVDYPTSRPETGARSSASAAGPGSPVSKRRNRNTPKQSTVHPSNPCRSVRRVWVKPRPGSRSKAYTKSLSPSTSTVSARSGYLNKLIASIHRSVHRLEMLLLSEVLR